MHEVSFRAFANELLKSAAKVPVVHGTSGLWDVLRPGVGASVFRRDPNPRAVYVAIKNRAKIERAEEFARDAVRAKGGLPVVALAKVDTEKGWRPFQLSAWGKENIGSIEDAHALVDELDAGAKGERRAEIWQALQRGTGSWRNDDLGATVRPTKYRPARAVRARGPGRPQGGSAPASENE